MSCRATGRGGREEPDCAVARSVPWGAARVAKIAPPPHRSRTRRAVRHRSLPGSAVPHPVCAGPGRARVRRGQRAPRSPPVARRSSRTPARRGSPHQRRARAACGCSIALSAPMLGAGDLRVSVPGCVPRWAGDAVGWLLLENSDRLVWRPTPRRPPGRAAAGSVRPLPGSAGRRSRRSGRARCPAAEGGAGGSERRPSRRRSDSRTPAPTGPADASLSRSAAWPVAGIQSAARTATRAAIRRCGLRVGSHAIHRTTYPPRRSEA